MKPIGLTGPLLSELREQVAREISEAEVHCVLNQLWTNKITFSKEKVRELLGHRGSYTTISKHIDSWRQDSFPSPDGFDVLLKAYASIQKMASREFEVSLKAITTEYEEKLMKAQDARAFVQNQHKEALQQLESSKNEILELFKSHKETVNSWQNEEKKCLIIEETNRLLQQQLQDAKLNYQQQKESLIKEHELSIKQLQNQYNHNQEMYEDKILA